MSSTPITITEFGFTWGATTIERVFSIDGRVCLSVKTQRQTVEVYVTKTGLVRVFKRGKGEMKTEKGKR